MRICIDLHLMLPLGNGLISLLMLLYLDGFLSNSAICKVKVSHDNEKNAQNLLGHKSRSTRSVISLQGTLHHNVNKVAIYCFYLFTYTYNFNPSMRKTEKNPSRVTMQKILASIFPQLTITYRETRQHRRH